MKNKLKTHCPLGHLYSGDNLYIHKGYSRRCKECQRQHMEKFYERKRNQNLKRVGNLGYETKNNNKFENKVNFGGFPKLEDK